LIELKQNPELSKLDLPSHPKILLFAEKRLRFSSKLKSQHLAVT
jgi:hypothetical protein